MLKHIQISILTDDRLIIRKARNHPRQEYYQSSSSVARNKTSYMLRN